MNTCGPWRPISLEVYEARVADVSCETVVDEGLGFADVEVLVELEGEQQGEVKVELTLDGEEVAAQTVGVDGESVKVKFNVDKPALWYPLRYGKQPLYQVKATLLRGDEVVDEMAKKIGLRRARLVQRPLKDQPGTSFFFEVNNIPVYCGGSDWIPADNFIPRISRQKYYDWIKLVADGNQSMIRVWGGGIYEEQAFYDACDEYGILVWQDFMFGCGNYPAGPEMRESIHREAEANVRLLRHHPSIVIWAGNNEDYQYQESEGLTYNYEDKDPENWLKTDFPARYIVRPPPPTPLLPRLTPTRSTNTYSPPSAPPSPPPPPTTPAPPGAPVATRTTRPSATSTNGTCGTAPKSPTKTSIASPAASSRSSACKPSPRPSPSTRTSRSGAPTRTATRSPPPSTSTTRPRATSAASLCTWWRTCGTRRRRWSSLCTRRS